MLGQTILAHGHEIRPGQTLLVADGLEIKLEPRESASDDAQRYFKVYKRARDATRGTELVAVADRELAHLDEMDTLVRIADDPSRIYGRFGRTARWAHSKRSGGAACRQARQVRPDAR